MPRDDNSGARFREQTERSVYKPNSPVPAAANPETPAPMEERGVVKWPRVELVFGAAAGAPARLGWCRRARRRWRPNMRRGWSRGRAEWGDQALVASAAGAGAGATQRGGVARVADRAFRPAHRCRAGRPAVGALAGSAWPATTTDRLPGRACAARALVATDRP
jgi:hypothetical protein